MTTLLTILKLIWEGLVGDSARKPAPPSRRVPVDGTHTPIVPVPPEPEDDTDYTDPEPIGAHHAPPRDIVPAGEGTAPPNILVPDPVNQDSHGPASSIARAMLRKDYEIFDNNTHDHNLNIVGIRNSERDFDVFQCRLVHFYLDTDGNWQMADWPITTYPGKRYTVDKLLNPRGAFILAPGQYRDTYRIRKHRGQYDALCQDGGPVRGYRDKNRDRVYDLDPKTIDTGYFGINIHAPENPADGVSKPFYDRVYAASAGCQVHAGVQNFVDCREQWRAARATWANNFTYTLIEDIDLDDPGTVQFETVQPQLGSKADKWNPSGTTRGIRNKNILNVKRGSEPWNYTLGVDSEGHEIFNDHAHGIRAAIITLRTYWTTHGHKTVGEILSRWAPSTDTLGSLPGMPANSPRQYAKFVADRIGWPADKKLMTFTDEGAIRSPDQLYALVAAMAAYENYSTLQLPRETFDRGLALV